jgi:hypothetical protein
VQAAKLTSTKDNKTATTAIKACFCVMLHHPNIFFQLSSYQFWNMHLNGMGEQTSQLWFSTKDKNNPSHRMLKSIRQGGVALAW